MSKPRLQMDAPIIPDHSLGGLDLRTNIAEIQDLVMDLQVKYLVSQNKLFTLLSPLEARYEFTDYRLQVYVDVRNGKIYKLAALPGYEGLLFNKIHVGMKVSEAMALKPDLYYDEATEVILCKSIPGLAIDVPETDPPPEEVPVMTISAISIYAEEAFTPSGNLGQW